MLDHETSVNEQTKIATNHIKLGVDRLNYKSENCRLILSFFSLFSLMPDAWLILNKWESMSRHTCTHKPRRILSL